MATTMVAKLSSVSTMVAASLATSVPERPMATPMSARRRAGASLTPSPVIATVWPSARSASAMRSLDSGEARAKMSSWPVRSSLSRSGSLIWSSSPPVMTGLSAVPMPSW
jgi:hypothetical protein